MSRTAWRAFWPSLAAFLSVVVICDALVEIFA